VVAFSVPLALRHYGDTYTDYTASALPDRLALESATLTGRTVELDERISAILNTEDITYRRYQGRHPEPWVDALIVFSLTVRNAVHPPQVCLQGGGQFVVERHVRAVDVPEVGEVRFTELITQKGNDYACHWFVYRYGKQYTPNYFHQQARVFFTGLFTGKSSGALIRLSTGFEPGESTQARQRLKRTAERAMPKLHHALP